MNEPQPPGLDPDQPTNRWFTIPNLLSLFRWVGSLLLIYFGWQQQPQAFVVWFLVLTLSDWIDGKIAVYFHMRSILGARLDSFADATLFVAALIGGLALWHARLAEQWPWILAACGSYAIATLYGLIKFGRWPSYHTRTAKGSWLFAMAAVGCLAWELPIWPLQLAMVSVTIANLESMAITYLLKEWHADVISVFIIKHGEVPHRAANEPAAADNPD